MALITCPDCGKQFSSYAEACPFCGRPRCTIVGDSSEMDGAAQPGPDIVQEQSGKSADRQSGTASEQLQTFEGVPRLTRHERIAIARGNRMARAGLVFSILCAVTGTISWQLANSTSLHILLSRRGGIIMAFLTTVFFVLSQPLSYVGFFRRIFNKGGVSGTAITGIALSTMGVLMALLSLLNLPSQTYI